MLVSNKVLKAVLICVVLSISTYCHVRYVPFFSHGHKHMAKGDDMHFISRSKYTLKERWELQSTSGDQLQLLCLIGELGAGLVGIVCVFTRAQWINLPASEKKPWMYAFDIIISISAAIMAFGPPLSSIILHGKEAKEEALHMAALDDELKKLTSHAVYVSEKARQQAFVSDNEVERYRVVAHTGVPVYTKFAKKNSPESLNGLLLTHEGEHQTIEFGAVIEPMRVLYDNAGVGWLCVEKYKVPGTEDSPAADQTINHEASDADKEDGMRSRFISGLNKLEDLTGVDFDRDGDVGADGAQEEESGVFYEEVWVPMYGAKDAYSDDAFIELVDVRGPLLVARVPSLLTSTSCRRCAEHRSHAPSSLEGGRRLSRCLSNTVGPRFRRERPSPIWQRHSRHCSHSHQRERVRAKGAQLLSDQRVGHRGKHHFEQGG